MTSVSLSSTCPEGCAEEGRTKAAQRGEEKRRLAVQDAKGQVHAVDVVISDRGRGVIPLRGRESDRVRALPHSSAMYVTAEKCGGPGHLSS